MSASAEDAKKLEGVYNFEHPGGSFPVHLRSDGRYFAPQFQARATWTVSETGLLEIDWGKFGKYELNLTDGATRAFSGSKKGEPANWRKMVRTREFSVVETMLMDSEWELEHPKSADMAAKGEKGTFNVEFRADGFNHCARARAHTHTRLSTMQRRTQPRAASCRAKHAALTCHSVVCKHAIYRTVVCNDFPAHSHWRLESDTSTTPTLKIDWGKYGKYELVIDASGQSMSGSAEGQPTNWRKLKRVRALGQVAEAHVHDH